MSIPTCKGTANFLYTQPPAVAGIFPKADTIFWGPLLKGYDRVVGQLLRYMNWVRKELAEPGQRVRGIIVCRTMSEDLRLACMSIPDVELFEYQLSVSVLKVPALELRG